MSRHVTLVLVDGDGTVLGTAPPFTTTLPYWQEMSDLVPAARALLGTDVAVLRLLRAERPRPPGGAVTYLAQVDAPVAARLGPVDAGLAARATSDDPHRAPYAMVGGPAASMAWCRDALGGGAALTVAAQRTWNLSALWRVDDGTKAWWLKQLPVFLRGEIGTLAWLGEVAPDLAPVVVATGDDGRLLMTEAPGTDLYGTDLATRARILAAAHRIQRAGVEAADELVARGVPDRRGAQLAAWIRTSLDGWVGTVEQQARLDGLDDALAAVDACGMPATLVHGDAHPGNARGDDEHLTLLDWGEATVSHPARDVLGLVDDLSADEADALVDVWAGLWRADVPGCDPQGAVERLRPIVALCDAALFASFVAHIEATERPYHELDPPERLARAMDLGARP